MTFSISLLAFDVTFFFFLAIMIECSGIKLWFYLHSLMANSVENLFMCLFAICISSEKCHFMSFVGVLIGLHFFCLFACFVFVSVFFAIEFLDNNFLSNVWFAGNYFQSVACLFIVLTALQRKKLLF